MHSTALRNASAVLILTALAPLIACGPWFPDRFLDGGDEMVLRSPFAAFGREIQRMRLLRSRHQAKPTLDNQSHADQTIAADTADLGTALAKAGWTGERAAALVARYAHERAKLHALRRPKTIQDSAGATPQSVAEPIVLPGGLPAEFARYLRGAIAWRKGDVAEATAQWERLLELPSSERRFKSAWAAFMLGRVRLESDPERARRHFQQVRSLAQAGFPDALGLAAASLGWEAKTHYDKKDFLPALELYLEQADSGDASALVSLRWIAAAAFRERGPLLEQFARHPLGQRVFTAYLLDRHVSGDEAAVVAWLQAMEQAGITHADSAEQLALAAYRHGQIESARRWIALSQRSIVSQWLDAKLLLRDGKIDQAAARLSQLTRFFPLTPMVPELRAKLFQSSLYVSRGGGEFAAPAEYLWGELATLQVSRREYGDALDAFLRAGFWHDAAFVAERVLTVDELQRFVAQRWSHTIDPELETHTPDPALDQEIAASQERWTTARHHLRHLLARRLTRLNRGVEARPYFPNDLLVPYDALMHALHAADDASRSNEERAEQYMTAARLARQHGLELLGTELEPDFAISHGNFDAGVSPAARPRFTLAARESPAKSPILFASADEWQRTATPPADPFLRFHYRYLAADLAWAAAELLPDNTGRKAQYLCEGGSWIKLLSPARADRFYKALVRQCGRTELGRRADALRWFPLLDEKGQLRPQRSNGPVQE